MTIVRYEKGTQVPRDARYSLVGHYGEPTGFVVWCSSGESLPPPPPGDLDTTPPLWYVEVADVAVSLIAA
jgi:hypothetical protein